MGSTASFLFFLIYIDPSYLPASHHIHPCHQYPEIFFFNFECTGNPRKKPTKSIILNSISDQQCQKALLNWDLLIEKPNPCTLWSLHLVDSTETLPSTSKALLQIQWIPICTLHRFSKTHRRLASHPIVMYPTERNHPSVIP